MSTVSRTWSEDQLTRARPGIHKLARSHAELGLSGTSAGAIRTIRGHATRLELDVSHFRGKRPSIAAAWFAMRGCDVLFPIEPAVYDLVVSMPEGLRRVQVKTTTSRNSTGWQVGISRHPHSLEKGGWLSGCRRTRRTSWGTRPGCLVRVRVRVRMRRGGRRSCRSRCERITLAAFG